MLSSAGAGAGVGTNKYLRLGSSTPSPSLSPPRGRAASKNSATPSTSERRCSNGDQSAKAERDWTVRKVRGSIEREIGARGGIDRDADDGAKDDEGGVKLVTPRKGTAVVGLGLELPCGTPITPGGSYYDRDGFYVERRVR